MSTEIEKIKSWLDKYYFDCDVEIGEDSCYDSIKECIIYSENKEDHMEEYINYCKKLGLKKEFNWKTIVILHELGHHQTMDTLSDFEYFIDSLFRPFTELPSYSNISRKIKISIYYRLPLEKSATKWLVEFVNLNSEKVNELNNIFQ